MKQVTLEEADFKKLVELYTKAQRTPMIAMSVADGIAGRDWSTMAWNEVRAFMDQLGKKYGYKPQTAQISMDSSTFQVEEA